MASARVICQAHVDALQAASLPFVWQWTLPAAILERVTLSWGPGDTTLAPPPGATMVVIDPPATTPGTLKVGKANVAADGWMISSVMPTLLTLGTGPFILAASGAVSNIELTYL